MLQAEQYILKTLEWNLSYANPIYFLQRVSRANDHDVKARTIAQYLIEISCLEWRLLSAPPSLLAAAAVWLARLILNNETWVHHSTSFIMCYYLLRIRQTPSLAHHSSYDKSQLVQYSEYYAQLCTQTYQARIILPKICQQEIL